jgi:hypothetical protein
VPPSTNHVWPTTKLDRGDARKAIASATSSGRPQRPIGIGIWSRFAGQPRRGT